MRVQAIMLPFNEITCISLTDTVGQAIEIINEKNLLSLPVVDGETFVGVLSKQYVFEAFFNGDACGKEEFLQKPVQEFMKTKLDTIPESLRIEEAAAKFITSKVRFLPVTDEFGHLNGIVTQQAVFRQYHKLFGERFNSLVVVSYDVKGTLAKLCETIYKAGGDIRNMIISRTSALDMVEIFVRIDTPNFAKVVKALTKENFDVREVKNAADND